VDFAVNLVDSVLHLTNGQVKFLGKICEEIQITEKLQDMKFCGDSENDFWAVTS